MQARFLSDERGGRATGRLTVSRGAGIPRGLAAKALEIPAAGDYDLVLEVTPHRTGQGWVRRFGTAARPFKPTTSVVAVESSGLASLGFELVPEGETLYFVLRRAWGARHPSRRSRLCCVIEVQNVLREPSGWWVRVRFSVPVLGFVGQYEGEVVPDVEVARAELNGNPPLLPQTPPPPSAA